MKNKKENQNKLLRAQLGSVLAVLIFGLFFGFSGRASAATDIYRSVGVGATAPLATGASNALTISGSTATFANALADNIGVGDAIQYDSDNNGTIDAIAFIHGRTSSTVYTVKSNAGTVPAASSAADNDWSIYRAYTSLFNAERGDENDSIDDNLENFDDWIAGGLKDADEGGKNIVTADQVWNIACYNGQDNAADTMTVTISGWTTGADNYLRIYTPKALNKVGTSQRHNGVWDMAKYRMEVVDASAIVVYANYVRIEGLQLTISAPTAARAILTYGNTSPTTNDLRVSNNILRGHNDGVYTESAIEMTDADIIARVWNNIIYDIPTFGNGSNRGISFGGSVGYIYNNTISGAYSGIRRTAGTVVLKNNVVQSAVSTGYMGTFDASSDYNISNRASETTTISPSYRPGLATTVTFQDTGSKNFHLDAADVGAKDQGVILKTVGNDSNLYFTYDIDNNTRPDSAWDIGADEQTAVDSTAPVLAEVMPVTTPTSDTTPDYVFSSTEAGTIIYGGACISVTTDATPGSNTVTFSELGNGTYSDCTITVFDSSNNVSDVLTISSFTVTDLTPPTIQSVNSDKTNGTYGEGEVIDVDVTFSEAVTSTGDVTVVMETGTTDRSCVFTVSNSTSGTCNYTVLEGDVSSDLTVSSISGTIADQYGNSMTNFVPVTNLADNKALVIDTVDVTYYIDAATGNDSDSGTSLESAWATIGKANSTVKAGDKVIISAGTYEEAIQPTNNGYANAHITYVAKTGDQPVIRQAFFQNKQYIKVIGFEITHDSLTFNHAITFYGVNHIEIINNYIHHTYGQAIRNNGDIANRANYNTIRGNTIAYIGCPTGVAGSCTGHNGIYLTGSSNLVEYNDISHTLDFIDLNGGHNIIRNNYLHHFQTEDFPDSVPDEAHVDIFQPFGIVGEYSDRNIFENNFAADNVEFNSHYFQIRDESLSGEKEFIIRGNVGARFGSYVAQFGAIDYTRVYNNTFSDFASGISYTIEPPTTSDDESTNNFNFNNIYYKTVTAIYQSTGCTVDASNNACEQSGSHGSCLVTSNISYSDYANSDFHLQSGSSARNAGKVMTTVTSVAGSGTSFTAADAGFFVGSPGINDPTGAEIGDLIKVGSNSAVRITAIDYDTNTITVGSSVSWNSGDPIVLSYQDVTPDIGAYEYASDYTYNVTASQPAIVSPGVVRLAASVDNTSNVRYVEFYVDNVPVGADSSAPYTFDWNSGTSETVYNITAKAYGLLASTTLSDSSSLSFTYGSDTTDPTVTAFTIPATSNSLTVPITTFTATDDTAVTGYMLTESSSAPASDAAGWEATAPEDYAFTTEGTKTLYAWAKDAAGNVSESLSDSVTITLPTYTIGGTISGLTGTVVLQNNGGDDLSRSASGSFTFATGLYESETYEITVSSQPDGQTCTVSNGSGTVSSENITNISVTCEDGADTVAPTVNAFTIPSTSSSLTVQISIFTATDDTAVTGYMVTESSSAPAAGDAGWSVTAPEDFAFITEGSKTLYAWAKDAAGNVSESLSDSVTVALPDDDSAAPTLSNGSPNNQTLAASTTSTNLSLITNENATCRYSTTANTAYASMTEPFSNTGSTSHSTTINGLSNGTTYHYYIRCQDGASNANTNDYALTFSVAPAQAAEEIRIGNPVIDLGENLDLSKKQTAHINQLSATAKGRGNSIRSGKVRIYSNARRIKTVNVTSSGRWEGKVRLKRSTRTLKFKYYNSLGTLVSTQTRKVRIDTKKPKFTQFIKNSRAIAGSTRLSWKAKDNVSIDRYKIYFNGYVYTQSKNDRDIILPKGTSPGIHKIKVKAYDKAGNSATRSASIRVR